MTCYPRRTNSTWRRRWKERSRDPSTLHTPSWNAPPRYWKSTCMSINFKEIIIFRSSAQKKKVLVAHSLRRSLHESEQLAQDMVNPPWLLNPSLASSTSLKQRNQWRHKAETCHCIFFFFFFFQKKKMLLCDLAVNNGYYTIKH